MINKKILISQMSLCVIASSLLLSGCNNQKDVKLPSQKNPIMELVCIENTTKLNSYDYCETQIYVDTKTGIEYFGTNIKGQMYYNVRLDQDGKPRINKKYLDKLINPNIEENNKNSFFIGYIGSFLIEPLLINVITLYKKYI